MNYLHFIFVYCLRFFMLLYFMLELLIFVWKGSHLPYYLPIYFVELFLLCVLLLLQYLCVKVSELEMEIVGCLLSVPAVLTTVYFLTWQQYVLYAELILSSFQIGFQGAYMLSALTSKLFN